ncbi:peptidylprolyl isomerase, partial [Chloroflexota bacterium]
MPTYTLLIVKVNDKVYDMGYFVKMLRLQQLYGYSWGQDYYQDIQMADYVADAIRDNELKIQEAEEEYGINITDDEIDEELKSQARFDPESESEEEFYQRIEDILKERDISMTDFKQLYIEPIVLQKRLLEAFGDTEYPEGSLNNHVQVRAMLLGTEEEALEVRDKWDGDFNQIIKDYSPTRYYPDSGYWLVMVTDKEGEDEGDDLYVSAILLATEEKADEVAAEFDGSNFADLAELYSLDSSGEDGGDMGWMSLDEVESQFGNLDAIQALAQNEVSDPIPENYPDEALEWLPEGIESSIFDGYAFDEGSVGSGVSEPIRDTTYYTKGGYWLVMVYEPEDAEEEEEDGLYIKAILLDSEEEAEDIADEFDGDNFADLAEEYSLHSSSDDGGDMGLMSLEDIESRFGAGVLADINDLSQDEISTPIENTDGYWLVIVTEGDGEGEEGEQYINAILLATEDKAEEVAAEFDGSNFADLAEEYSLDISAEDGGDMGWMSQEDIESKFGAGVLAI